MHDPCRLSILHNVQTGSRLCKRVYCTIAMLTLDIQGTQDTGDDKTTWDRETTWVGGVPASDRYSCPVGVRYVWCELAETARRAKRSQGARADSHLQYSGRYVQYEPSLLPSAAVRLHAPQAGIGNGFDSHRRTLAHRAASTADVYRWVLARSA
jgi:hypothetical protein